MVQGALGGRSEVDYARCVLLLFCPWTTHPDDASAAVPYLGDLCKFGKTDWRRALRRRLILRGFPTEEVKSFALNFCFVYCLPRELRPDQHLQENSDNEVQDEPVFFDEADLEAARATHVRGAGKLGSGDAGENGEEDGEVEDEAAATRLGPPGRRAARRAPRPAREERSPGLLGPKTRSLTTTQSPRPPARRGASPGCRCSRASAWPRGIPKRSRLGRT